MSLAFSPSMAAGSLDRLLPAAIPFRFFASAITFNIAAWLVLALSRDPVAGHLGGKGAVVAALHLMTLGVLAMAAMGAGYQLLPMATARPVRSVRGSATSFWLASPGVALFTGGLAVGVDAATHAGAALVAAGLTLFAMLTADNLRGAAAMPLVRRHVQVALVSLIATIVLGLILLVDWERGFLPDHLAAAGAHAAVAAYGFMGMLVLGFSTILVPMLALAQAPDRRLGQWVLALAAAGLVLTLLGGLAGVPLAMAGGAVLGLAAALLHITAMTRVIKRRMKKQLGPSFLLIRAGWCLLVASLMLAAALSLDLVPSPWATLLGVLLVPGWLLTSLFGFLQRIMPILAQAHLTVPGARPPLVSALTPEMPLKIHGMAHLAAVAVLTVAVVVGSEWLVRVAAVLGLVAALSFAVFAAILYRRALVCRRGG